MKVKAKQSRRNGTSHKSIWINAELHQKVKVLAVGRKITIEQQAEDLLRQGLKGVRANG